MKCILKIARSPKTKRVYCCFDLGYTLLFISIDDAVKLTGICYSELNAIAEDKTLIYEVNIQAVPQ